MQWSWLPGIHCTLSCWNVSSCCGNQELQCHWWRYSIRTRREMPRWQKSGLMHVWLQLLQIKLSEAGCVQWCADVTWAFCPSYLWTWSWPCWESFLSETEYPDESSDMRMSPGHLASAICELNHHDLAEKVSSQKLNGPDEPNHVRMPPGHLDPAIYEPDHHELAEKVSSQKLNGPAEPSDVRMPRGHFAPVICEPDHHDLAEKVSLQKLNSPNEPSDVWMPHKKAQESAMPTSGPNCPLAPSDMQMLTGIAQTPASQNLFLYLHCLLQ